MSKETTNGTMALLLVTKPSLQATALLNQLNNLVCLSSKLHNINKPVPTPDMEELLVLFDLSQADRKLISYWQKIAAQHAQYIKILLLNTPDDYPFNEIENWPKISAVFYPSMTEQQLIEGIESVIRGEYYFSPKYITYIINQSNQHRFIGHDDFTRGITQREKEILNKLRIGASNTEIAQQLFISENTVKTHLYNLFKKISVKNRTQAVSWANKNLRH